MHIRASDRSSHSKGPRGIRLRHVPGIAFVDGATGRRAVIADTGLDVWEVIATVAELLF